MTSDINDTDIVKKTIGSRLQKAREKKDISRKAVVDLLNINPKAPSFKATKLLQEGTYKKWEYGENPVQLEWIPALCEVLSCDVGYLFGEYEEIRRELSDAHKTTGLSEDSIKILEDAESASGYEDIANPNKIRIGILDLLIKDPKFFMSLLDDIYMCYEKYKNYRYAKKNHEELKASAKGCSAFPESGDEWQKVLKVGDAFNLTLNMREKYEVAVFKANREFGTILDNLIHRQFEKNASRSV